MQKYGNSAILKENCHSVILRCCSHKVVEEVPKSAVKQGTATVKWWEHSPPTNSQLQKCERTGTSFLYWLDWKSKHFNWNVTEWKATQPSLRVFSRKLFKWEPRKSCKIPYKSLQFCGLSTQSIQTLYFGWYL